MQNQSLVGGGIVDEIRSELERISKSTRADLVDELASIAFLQTEVKRLTKALEDLTAEAQHRQEVIDDHTVEREQVSVRLAVLERAVDKNPLTKRLVRRSL